jgi:hypothetical protein
VGGIGVAGTALAGMLFFGESTNVLRVLSLLLVLAGSSASSYSSDNQAAGSHSSSRGSSCGSLTPRSAPAAIAAAGYRIHASNLQVIRDDGRR